MATGFELAQVKPVVDALIAIFKKAKTFKLKSNANKALSEAIRDLLLASPNLKSAEAKIAVAKAAGIINEDLILAEEMVAKHFAAAKTKAPAKRAAKVAFKKAAPKKSKASAKWAAKAAVKKAASVKFAATRRVAF